MGGFSTLDMMITSAMGLNTLLTFFAAFGLFDAALSSGSGIRSRYPASYAPESLGCSSVMPSVRNAQNLSSSESAWLQKGKESRLLSLQNLLDRLHIEGFDVKAYFKSFEKADPPSIGIAFSGGGYRALMNGAGAFTAFDDRSENSKIPANGQLGGIIQSATYISGLSGGSWLVGSVYINNFPTIAELMNDQGGALWRFDSSVLQGPETEDDYYQKLIHEVDRKSNAGFQVSLTDYWGRALSYQLINATGGGPNKSWSSISISKEFNDGRIPIPIITALERTSGEKDITLNSSVFEITPWELGTWDPSTFAFMPLDYLGSNFRSGEIDGDTCTHGFDNAGFLMGTSSSLFNQALLQINNSGMRDSLQKVAESLLENLDESEKDVAIYKPNPFYLWSNDWRSKNAKEETLFLVDGGEDLQNIPFYPLLQPKRKVDVVIAIDSSADTEFSWPNGTSMLATYKRNLNPSGIGNGTAFPHVPDQNTFVNLRLNQRPTFFGCRSPYAAGEKRTTGPLIIYIPNSPYSFYSNVSTFDLEFSASKRDSIILNGYNVATMGNGSVDSRWPTCVGCAILSRSLERTNTSEPHECVECFESYCWNGTISSTAPDSYQPTLILESGIGKGLKIWNTFLLSMIQIVLGEATFSLMF